MKTITMTLSDEEFAVLSALTAHLDPTGSIKPTSVAKGCLVEGLVRSYCRLEKKLPRDWQTTESVSRSRAAV